MDNTQQKSAFGNGEQQQQQSVFAQQQSAFTQQQSPFGKQQQQQQQQPSVFGSQSVPFAQKQVPFQAPKATDAPKSAFGKSAFTPAAFTPAASSIPASQSEPTKWGSDSKQPSAAQPSGVQSKFGDAAKPAATTTPDAAKPASSFGGAGPKQPGGFVSSAFPSAFGGAAKPSTTTPEVAKPASSFGAAQKQPAGSASSAFPSAFGGAAKPSTTTPEAAKPASPFGGGQAFNAPSAILGKEPAAAAAAGNKNTAFLFNSQAPADAAKTGAPVFGAPKAATPQPFSMTQQPAQQVAKDVAHNPFNSTAAAGEAKDDKATGLQQPASFKFGSPKEEPSKPAESCFGKSTPLLPVQSTAVFGAKRTAQDLQTITGLKKQYAEECFLKFGSYEVALASFAQSLPLLPKDRFDAYENVAKNAQKMNEQLKSVYQKARELTAGGATAADAWKHFAQAPASVSLDAKKVASVSAPAAAAPAPAPAAPAPKPAPAQPTAAAAGFGFGTKDTEAKPAAATSAPSLSPSAGFQFGEKKASETNAAAATTAPAPASGFKFVGFGEKPPATSEAAAANPAPAAFTGFGFGEKTPASTNPLAAAPAVASSFGFGFGGGAATATTGAAAAAEEEQAEPEKEEKKPEVIYCEPEHFTGPFFDMPRFWETEVTERCALLNLNGGFIEANRQTLQPRLEKWVKRANFYRSPVRYAKIVDRDEEVTRVIIKDADRTFNEPEHREKLVQFLHAMYHEFNAYGQAMSYLAGLCMLVLNEDDTAAVLRYVSKEHIRGHWAAEAVGFATSAWTVHYFMEKRFPEVSRHLMELKFWPDTYLQKILTGLCIHVLPFQELFVFLDAFMEGGMRYLIKFCLSIVERFQARLLAIKDSMEANKVYEMMRLDSHATNITDVRAILARAPQMELGEEEKHIDVIRSEMYDKHVLPRLQKAPKKDTFEPCAVCEKNRPKWWNDDLGHVCDACKAKHPEEAFESF